MSANILSPSFRALEAEIKEFCVRSHLTPREREVLSILVEGVVRIKNVADRLGLSPNTVNNHVNSIFMKTRTRSKSQLLAELLNHVAEELEKARFLKQSPRLALLEGEGSNTEALVKVLNSRGFKVTCSRSQEELDACILSLAPHFVIAPLFDLGEDACRFLKRVSRLVTPAPSVLLLGEGSGIMDRCQAMQAGAMDLIPFPFDAAQIYQILMGHYIEEDFVRARFLALQRRDKPGQFVGVIGENPVDAASEFAAQRRDG